MNKEEYEGFRLIFSSYESQIRELRREIELREKDIQLLCNEIVNTEKFVMDIDIKKDKNKLACVYLLFKNKEVIYVGSTLNLAQRMAGNKYFLDCDWFMIYEVENEDEKKLRKIEEIFINAIKPKLNKSMKTQLYKFNFEAWAARISNGGL